MEVTNVQIGEAGAQPAAVAPAAPKQEPSSQVLEDVTGRKYWLRKLKPSERYLLSDAVEANTFSATMQIVTAASVMAIGDPGNGCPPIRNKAELLRRLDEIGDEGLVAITPTVMKWYGGSFDQKEVEIAKN
jgi:hypothetical protein